jgi:hypothetical protein
MASSKQRIVVNKQARNVSKVAKINVKKMCVAKNLKFGNASTENRSCGYVTLA